MVPISSILCIMSSKVWTSNPTNRGNRWTTQVRVNNKLHGWTGQGAAHAPNKRQSNLPYGSVVSVKRVVRTSDVNVTCYIGVNWVKIWMGWHNEWFVSREGDDRSGQTADSQELCAGLRTASRSLAQVLVRALQYIRRAGCLQSSSSQDILVVS